jgi:hypothetical protein
MSGDKDTRGKKQTYEFHFQEGFTGQTFQIIASGLILATVTATTRLQVGLAAIEAIQLQDGEEVLIRQKDTKAETLIRVHQDKPIVTLRWVNGQLEVRATGQPQGYL